MTITEKIESLGRAKHIGTFEHDTAEWHAARYGVGGSDVAAIMGKSPFKSAWRLWAEKTGQLIPDIFPSIAMRMGSAFESPIIDLFEQDAPDITVHRNVGTWQSTKNDAWKANPDGILEWSDGSLGVLEVKFSRNYWYELPPAYELQVQWYMHTLGIHTALVIAVAAGDWKEYRIDYDPKLAADMEIAVNGFQRLVETTTPPNWTGSQDEYEAVRETSDTLIDDEAELPAELYLNLKTWRHAYETAELQFTRYKSETLNYLQGIKTGLFEGKPVIKLQERNKKPFITFTKDRD